MSAALGSVVTRHPLPAAEPTLAHLCLAIGLPNPIAQTLAGGRRVVHLSLCDLATRQGLAPMPDLVVCPLVASWGDAPDVMTLLRQFSYRGPLLIIGHRLPDAAMVEGELKRRARGLRFSLLNL